MNPENEPAGDQNPGDARAKHSGAELLAVIERYETILASLSQGVIINSDDGGVEFANQALCNLYHLNDTPPQLVGLSAPDMLKRLCQSYAESDRVLARAQEIVTHRQPVKSLEMSMEDGRTVLIDFIPVDLKGKQNCRLWFHYDITERKWMEERLRRSEDNFRLMVEGLPLAIVLTSDVEGKIIHMNPRFVEMFGYTLEDVSTPDGWWPKAYPDAEYRDFVMAEWKRNTELALQNQSHCKSYESRITCKDGSVKDIEWGFVLIGNRRITFGYDITARKQAEQARDRLEAQNRQLHKSEGLGRMAGAIAHHFNNQLQAVMMNLDMAREEMVQTESIGHLDVAKKAAKKLAEMSRSMLVYLGQSRVQNETLDFSLACQQQLAILSPNLHQGVELEVDLSVPGPLVHGNANQLQQVLTSLLTNAVEAMSDGPGGKIRLTVKECRAADILADRRFPVDYQPPDRTYACLTVADEGIGIPEKDIENLFDPFFSSKFTGRGLGLSVVLGIVRAHHGVITVASRVGHGSVFRVFLPVS